jgi:hypothetical protein
VRGGLFYKSLKRQNFCRMAVPLNQLCCCYE